MIFKTRTPFFEKERDGLKCNTVRELGHGDIRFEEVMHLIQTGEEKRIVIRNPKTGEKFDREITDVTYYNERFIISWKHSVSLELDEGEEKE